MPAKNILNKQNIPLVFTLSVCFILGFLGSLKYFESSVINGAWEYFWILFFSINLVFYLPLLIIYLIRGKKGGNIENVKIFFRIVNWLAVIITLATGLWGLFGDIIESIAWGFTSWSNIFYGFWYNPLGLVFMLAFAVAVIFYLSLGLISIFKEKNSGSGKVKKYFKFAGWLLIALVIGFSFWWILSDSSYDSRLESLLSFMPYLIVPALFYWVNKVNKNGIETKKTNASKSENNNVFIKSLIWVMLFDFSIAYLFKAQLASILGMEFGQAQAMELFGVSLIALLFFDIMNRFKFYKKTETINHNINKGDVINILFYLIILVVLNYLGLPFLLAIIGSIIAGVVYEFIKAFDEIDIVE